MAVCKACGTENRNKAKFCRGCAAPLPPEPASARGGVLPEHICPTCKVRNSAKALFCQACGVPLVPPSVAFHPMPELPGGGSRQRVGVLLAGLVLVLAGLGTWWKLSHSNGSPSLAATAEATAPVPASTSPNGPATPAPAQATPASAVAPDAAATSPAPGDATHLSEAERLRLSLERLEREDKERTAALEQRRVAMAAEQQRRAELARRRAEAAAAAAAAAASHSASASSSSQPSTAATPAEAKTETAPPLAASAATVEAACAGSTNFFARDLCRIRECRKPSFASDPICVRFREMEEATRRKLAN
ncbi:zinc ribbon domain-containing protein [Hydrogenophaga taeniospiralis]|uniref:zinc ribbon domain-containing protein n=1 Tax=Hydrogenophaga taeniospiralis TaxID=65656 RepID=UPI000A04DB3E|nr:zinc ribbon domain-containing protein [Hydrogenophaga taeniospiralis]